MQMIEIMLDRCLNTIVFWMLIFDTNMHVFLSNIELRQNE